MLQPPLDTSKLWKLTPNEFWETSKIIFNWQAAHNPVYKQWVELNKSSSIAFLPISFFKTQDVFIGEKPVNLFESSGTTQDVKSNHWVQDLSLYEASFLKGFELFYGNPTDYCVIGLLPSYLERKHSSLVYMVDKLIKASCHTQSGFYLDDFTKLNEVLQDLEKQKQKVWFIGVSFALIDFAVAFPQQINSTIVLETGGMKGRKEELTRNELHQFLKEHLGTSTIHSEYGMTELLSQAYAIKQGVFKCPPWMKVMVAEEEDPTSIKETGRGVLHIIDLANIYSCCFIATEDIGEVFEDGSFTVLGRLDASARRGCSLLVV
ncbi:MAG: acyl transferase [Sediminibacterium sp.]|nr:MAG: acyl transferase [Sediminibacterium sp.]